MKTAKIGVLFLVAVMALAGAGAGYALWSETITISGIVNTGEVDIQFSDQKSNDPTGALSLDPKEHGAWTFDPALWTWNGARWDKDVASIDCLLSKVGTETNNDGMDTLTATITNGYPCYHGNIAFSIGNVGTIPVKIQSIKLVAVSKGGASIPVNRELVAGATVYIDADTGNIYDAQETQGTVGPWIQDFSITMSSLTISQQIDAYVAGHPVQGTGTYAIPGDIDVHVEQGASELAQYGFTIQIWGVQWNEYA